MEYPLTIKKRNLLVYTATKMNIKNNMLSKTNPDTHTHTHAHHTIPSMWRFKRGKLVHGDKSKTLGAYGGV